MVQHAIYLVLIIGAFSGGYFLGNTPSIESTPLDESTAISDGRFSQVSSALYTGYLDTAPLGYYADGREPDMCDVFILSDTPEEVTFFAQPIGTKLGAVIDTRYLSQKTVNDLKDSTEKNPISVVISDYLTAKSEPVEGCYMRIDALESNVR